MTIPCIYVLVVYWVSDEDRKELTRAVLREHLGYEECLEEHDAVQPLFLPKGFVACETDV